ncbi:MAG TPA: 30S ribosome-binding factor RbfA [Candidatus Ratteibacteria bacterium]|jgi:ribosome-binding factor A|uniref:Ribosome-binding factor A n=1 Tax=candidate division TA06 bacterium ADurb.Bin131 TaxID=1852827 RepID=A0A1V6CDK2_UNCT6|nr:MAG: Ribosome-binding factor A [candidate division TA06 bacterium ADurb.Bin131]HOC02888.1 30S ribosome-binding factor RbfA [bacterium]HRS05659.1 30S ribosome-binding factor RbfA [Candidatus Ratteibacteria bacterium]HON04939.1 30S ribosome-binding factor RbfA [bacterium]HOQ81860.1 30S ribosome-binding factor RbfA [bacterium]
MADRDRKNLKFANILKYQITQIIQKELSDPRIGFITITNIKISSDRRRATVYVSILGDEKQKKESLKGLTSAAGFIRHTLSRKIETRFTPEIEFIEDINPATRVEEILREIEGSKEQ